MDKRLAELVANWKNSPLLPPQSDEEIDYAPLPLNVRSLSQ
jgi:hypothetical protein